MLNKVNIIPIITEHFHTFRVPRNDKLLKRDLVLFLLVPALISFSAVEYAPKPSTAFLNISLTVHTLFIPLLVNVLFVIYGIQEKRNNDAQPPRTEKLLHEVYKNLSYAVLVSFVSILVTALAQVLGGQQAKSTLGSAHPVSLWTVHFVLFWLMSHLSLSILMIVKRTHVLLSAEFDRKADDRIDEPRTD